MNVSGFIVALVLMGYVFYGTIVSCDNEHFGDTKDWWEKTIFYQIYPRSFMDSDGDGIGDLRGITSKLHYLAETSIGAAWLSPIFESPMVDFGYDISDFTAIQPEYGTMEDFDELMAEAKRLDIKIILDLVPNHSSDQCEWFRRSVERQSGYEDYYIWHDGVLDADGVLQPPNNWVSVFYGSAWTWNAERGQFYFHQFTKEQPDLNYRNPAVVQEMNGVITFWLAKGVNGFRVDAINHMFEVEDLRDEPVSGDETDSNMYGYLNHYYTKDLPESAQMIYSWRSLLDEWRNEHGGETRIMMTEAYGNITSTMAYYGSDDGNILGSHIPFNFLLITDLNEKSDARDFLYNINKWLSYMPLGKTANWVLGNHDRPRVGTRYGLHRVDSMNMLLMTLPGAGITYNGEEIGMVDNEHISWEDTKDPAACNTNPDIYKLYSRDPVRTPFQWNDYYNAGFSSSPITWLPVHPNYETLNLRAQQEAERSHYKLYKRLAYLRQHRTMQYGKFQPLAINKYVLAYTRELTPQDDTFVVVINLSKQPQVVNLKVFESLPENLVIVATGIQSTYEIGDVINTNYFGLDSYDAVVLQHKVAFK